MKASRAVFVIIGVVLFILLSNTANIREDSSIKINATGNGSFATMLLPAVDDKGNGLVTNLTVEVNRGEGRSLVDIRSLLFWVDTQNSIRIAGNVAAKYTDVKLDNYDIVYTIATNASVVEGPSAGAALTIATIAALKNKKLRPDVMITGTINPDGSIGEIGDVFSKAQAAKAVNATTLLVPIGQSVEIKTGYEKTCKNYFVSKVCASTWQTNSLNISELVGINVIEVGNINDALSYLVVE
ncbi:MAG: S16 family serine protease [Candidatus Aenigmatarchaeota archaeon]